MVSGGRKVWLWVTFENAKRKISDTTKKRRIAGFPGVAH